LRSAIAAVFSNFTIVPEKENEFDPYRADTGRLLLVPGVRAEMLTGWDATSRDEIDPKYDGRLRRVPIPVAHDSGGSNNQQGTELWKYMTQNTFRLS
jgi:hypothetical protein